MIVLLLAIACATPDPCPNGDMQWSSAGLTVTEEEHGDGWGQDDCLGCHALAATHNDSCTDGVDLSAVREQATSGCTACHGDNGAP